MIKLFIQFLKTTFISFHSELFVKENGELVEEGDTLVRPKLARTLEIISEDPNAFYNPSSQLAQDIIADIQEYGRQRV